MSWRNNPLARQHRNSLRRQAGLAVSGHTYWEVVEPKTIPNETEIALKNLKDEVKILTNELNKLKNCSSKDNMMHTVKTGKDTCNERNKALDDANKEDLMKMFGKQADRDCRDTIILMLFAVVIGLLCRG